MVQALERFRGKKVLITGGLGSSELLVGDLKMVVESVEGLRVLGTYEQAGEIVGELKIDKSSSSFDLE